MKKLQNFRYYFLLTISFLFVFKALIFAQVDQQTPYIYVKTQSDSMLDEPEYTKGTINWVWCESGPKSYQFEISFDTSKTDNWYQLKGSGHDSARFVDDITKYGLHKPLLDGWQYFYRVQYGVIDEIPSGIYSDTVWSQQDTMPPIVDSLIVGMDTPNMIIYSGSGRTQKTTWLNKKEIRVKFVVSDISIKTWYDGLGNPTGETKKVRGAGIDSVCFYSGKINEDWWSKAYSCLDYYSDTSGAAGDSSVTDMVSQTLDDGLYAFHFRTTDAAHSPESRTGKMRVDGNETPKPDAQTLPMANIGIDTRKPFSKILPDFHPKYVNVSMDSISICYTANDVTNGQTFHSGINFVWLYYINPQGDTNKYKFDAVFEDSSNVESCFTVATKELDTDGQYIFYTIATDIAGNVQDNIKSFTLFVDTNNPDVKTNSVRDTSSSTNWQDSTTVAEQNWANDSFLHVYIDTTYDKPEDGYASGVDSLMFALNTEMTGAVTKKHDGNKKYLYNAPFSAEGEYVIYTAAKDSAGNKTGTSQLSQHIIKYDTTHPTLKSATIRDLSTHEISSTDKLKVEVHLEATDNFNISKIRLSEKEDLSKADVSFWCENDLNEDTCNVEFTFKYDYQNNDTLRLYCFVFDSAGNISNKVMDEILFTKSGVQINNLADLKADLVDICETSIPIFAQPNWTDSVCVEVRLDRNTSELTKIALSQQADFPDTTWDDFPPDGVTTHCFEVVSDTLILYCIGKNVSSGEITGMISDTIRLDTLPPDLNSLSLSDTTSNPINTAENGWTNNQTIEAAVSGKDQSPWQTNNLFATLCGDIVAPLDTIFTDSFVTFITLNKPMDTNIVSCLLSDSAGNYTTQTKEIIYDTTRPILDGINILSGPKKDRWISAELNNPKDPGDFGKIKWFQLAEDSAFARNDTLIEYAGTDIFQYELTEDSGTKTVFCRIRDAAGNWSATKKNSVYLYERPIFSKIDIKDSFYSDSTTKAFPGFTNDRDITIHLSSVKNIPKYVYIEWEWNGSIETVQHNYTDSTFQDILPGVLNTTYKTKCWLINDAGSSDTLFASITYDSTAPNFKSIRIDAATNDSLYNIYWECLNVPPDSLFAILINQRNLETSQKDTTFKILKPFHNPVNDKLRVIREYVSARIEICVKVRDFAGNWSIEEKCDIITHDSVPARAMSITPIDRECVHFAGSSPDRITVDFSESAVPDSSTWKESIILTNAYLSTPVLIDSTFPGTGAVSTLKIFTSINAPGKYELTVFNFKDLASNPGVDTTCSFYVYMEKDLGGTVERKSDSFNFIRFDVPPNSLSEDAVFVLEPGNEPPDIPGMEGFQAMANTCWSDNAKNCFTNELVDCTENIQITIGFDPAELDGSLNEELRMIFVEHGSIQWELLSAPGNTKTSVVSGNNEMSFSPLAKISGSYCIVKQTGEKILSNYPNPFAASKENTTIRFSLDKNDIRSDFKIKIYDLFGNLVNTLPCNVKEGVNEVEWDGRNSNNEVVANGGYLCVIKKGRVRKIAVIK